MTFNNAKTLVIATFIVAMILPFSAMSMASAQQSDEFSDAKIEKMAEHAKKLIEKLETETNPEKIVRIQNNLNKLMDKLNSAGLYTAEQFETVKADRMNDKPQVEEEEEEDSNANPRARSYCRNCNADPKSVHVKVGFDYRLWGWMHGTANGYWNEISNSDRNGFSQAYTGSWGSDYMHTWVQYYCENCNSADVTMTPYIANIGGQTVKDYGTTTKTIISSTIEEYYPSTQAYSNVRVSDNANLVAVLNTIR